MEGKAKLLLFLGLIVALVFPSSQPAFAHEGHEHIHLEVDIKPGSYPNAINLKSNGLVAVALLGSANLDLSRAVISEVKFGKMHEHDSGASPRRSAFEDVNQDGFLDLVFHFAIQETGLGSTDTMACLHGLIDGEHFCGHDSVKIVP